MALGMRSVGRGVVRFQVGMAAEDESLFVWNELKASQYSEM